MKIKITDENAVTVEIKDYTYTFAADNIMEVKKRFLKEMDEVLDAAIFDAIKNTAVVNVSIGEGAFVTMGDLENAENLDIKGLKAMDGRN